MAKAAKPADAKSLPIDRPFEPSILGEAERIADAYRIIIERHEDDRYYGRGLEYPYLLGDGPTAAEAFAAARAALISAVATDLERGEPPPAPSDEQRTLRIELPVSATEKLQLEEAARRKGFRSVSDYVRTTSLAG